MKKVLYLGTDPSYFTCPLEKAEVIHAPLIEIVPRPADPTNYEHLQTSSHLLFTSKYGVLTFFSHLKELNLPPPLDKEWVAVGSVTAAHLQLHGFYPHVATQETQEGVIALLQTLPVQKLFIPKSSRSRQLLFDWLDQQKISYHAIDAYDTHLLPLTVSWQAMDLIVFTSPSTVQAFVQSEGRLPPLEKCLAIGPITQAALEKY